MKHENVYPLLWPVSDRVTWRARSETGPSGVIFRVDAEDAEEFILVA
jgi:hypothetical protein